MKKKNNRIDLKDKSGWIGSTILLVTAIFFIYISFFALGDFFSSYETGICKNCFGPLKILNNPIPFIFFMAAYLGTNYVLFKFILKSKYIDSSNKSKKNRQTTINKKQCLHIPSNSNSGHNIIYYS